MKRSIAYFPNENSAFMSAANPRAADHAAREQTDDTYSVVFSSI
jgi:hypothetical protein